MMKKLLFLFALIPALVSCDKANIHKSPADTISGFAQKGYLVKGSQVTAIAYVQNMEPTGRTFPATITGSLGAFSINVKDANADYFELKAEGRYFDEITGNITESPICLEAFVASYDSKANLNLFTTITKGRIMKLVSEGMSYEKAKTQAQVEFLKTVNLAGANLDFTKLDITGGSDADAMLLLTTCAIQNERSASELTAILQNAASEFKENGTFSENTAKELFRPGQELDFEKVFDNLRRYYEENGLSKDDLPSYWKYFYLAEDETMKIISSEGFNKSSYTELETPEAVSGTYKIVSIKPFTVSTDVDWITFETKELEKEVYELKVNIEENKAYEKREGHLFLNDENSKMIKSLTFVQAQALPDVDPKKSLKGEGVPGKPYLIESLDDLLYMRDVYNSTDNRVVMSRTDGVNRPARNAFFNLVSDIDLSPVCGPDKGDWVPIGKFPGGAGFDGTLNCWKDDSDGLSILGQPGYTISGLYINNDKDYQGLFGVIYGGNIRGLAIDGNVSGGEYVGLLAGYAHNYINYSYVDFLIGGACDIMTRGSVSGDSHVGGILGYADVTIERSENYAAVTSTSESESGIYHGETCGGIAGSSSTINGCRNYGTITNTYPSGFAGGISGEGRDISDCGNYGKVSASLGIGGIAGNAYGSVINCYNRGDLCQFVNSSSHTENPCSMGGIVGSYDGGYAVKNCLSSGSITFEEGDGHEHIGAICGELAKNRGARIEQNYSLQEGIPAIGAEVDSWHTEGENIVQNCFLLTQAQMKGLEPYEGVLYKSKDGKSVNTLLESLNAFLEDNKNDLPNVHFWEYSTSEPYPVLSKTSIK